jgi:hypothetical protein
VTGRAEPSLSTYSSDQSVLDRSTVLDAPNQHDRVDALLPLIPGVVRGPDGLINMKGARSSQGGFLVNSANVTDPVAGNTTMDLPIVNWNIERGLQLPAIVDFLESQNAELLILQEVDLNARRTRRVESRGGNCTTAENELRIRTRI